jgi:hypothetical protein
VLGTHKYAQTVKEKQGEKPLLHLSGIAFFQMLLNSASCFPDIKVMPKGTHAKKNLHFLLYPVLWGLMISFLRKKASFISLIKN